MSNTTRGEAAQGRTLDGGTLRMLHLDSGGSLRGGQKQILLLLQGLQEQGHNVTLGCRPGPLGEEARTRKIPVLPLPLRGEWDVPSAWKIARSTKTHAIEIVHAHDARTHGVARLSQALGMHAPLVVHRRVSFPVVSRFWNRWKYLRGVSAYFVVARGIGEGLEHLGVPKHRIHWVPSSVDLQALDRDLVAALPEGVPEPSAGEMLVTCIGALEKEKGQHLLLSCIPRLLENPRSLRFLFLGEGRDREKLEAMACSLGVQAHCHFAGFVTPIAPILRRSTCVVLPTLSEGFSPAALESMAAGVPVIASATGGLLEIIAPGEDGLLFSPANREELQQAIREVLDDPRLQEELCQKAKAKVRRLYSCGQMVERTVTAYRAVTQTKGTRSV